MDAERVKGGVSSPLPVWPRFVGWDIRERRVMGEVKGCWCHVK